MKLVIFLLFIECTDINNIIEDQNSWLGIKIHFNVLYITPLQQLLLLFAMDY